MSCVAFDGRYLVSDSLREHFGVTREGPAKIIEQMTNTGLVAVFGVGSAAVWRGVAKYMHDSCVSQHERASVPEHLWKSVEAGDAEVGMIVRHDGKITAYSLEHSIWAPVFSNKMAHGAGWQWAMCRMITAGDSALEAVRCVAKHNYCVKGPFWLLDMTMDEGPQYISE